MTRLATAGGSASTSTSAPAGQITRPSRHIFMTEITQDDGKKKFVMSSQPLCDASIRMNTPKNRLLLLALIGLSAMRRSDEAANHYLELSVIHLLTHYRGTTPDVWSNIVGFLPGFESSVGRYALSVLKPAFFSRNPFMMDSAEVVDAVMRGQEDIVMNALNDAPSHVLTSIAVKNSVGVEYTVTPLQAAIMANDAQMAQRIAEYFAHIPSGNVIMEEQIIQIYKASLRMYYDKQTAEVERLSALQASGTAVDVTALTTAKKSNDVYEAALRSDNILDIFDAHNQTQEDNAFDFQPYVNAIINARTPAELTELEGLIALMNAKTPEETAAIVARTGVAATQTPEARDKAFDELTLVEKLNRFREELVKHMQQEIIFNPHHILAGLKINGTAWNDFCTGRFADSEYKKLSVIFSDLVGETQRKASELVKQDTRQGTYYLTNEDEPRFRPSCFNAWDSVNSKIVRNSLADVSLIDASSLDGLGYKFGAAPVRPPWPPMRAWCGQAFAFKTYVQQQQQAFRTYYAVAISTRCVPPCSVVVSC